MAIDTFSPNELSALADELNGAMPLLGEAERRVAVQLYRLLAQGEPVEPERLARQAGIPLPQVTPLLSSWPGVYRDDDGRVLGFWGLTVAEMPPHRFQVNGHNLWTWCALDALFIPEILRTPARVETTCVTTGQPVSMVVGPQGVTELSPAGSVLSLIRPDGPFDYNVILNFCRFVHFFSSEAAGRQWTSQRPNAFLLSVQDGFELGRLGVQRLYGPALDALAQAV